MLILSVVILIVVVAVLLLLAARKSSARRKIADEEWPVYADTPLSLPEQSFYFRLKQALPEHVVFAQMQYSQFISIKPGSEHWQAWRNRLSQKSADFVICDKSMAVQAVIELDDATHARADRRESDRVKEAALKAAGIRLIRCQAKNLPEESAITRLFALIPAAGKAQSVV